MTFLVHYIGNREHLTAFLTRVDRQGALHDRTPFRPSVAKQLCFTAAWSCPFSSLLSFTPAPLNSQRA